MTSTTAKNAAQPTNSHPSTFMSYLCPAAASWASVRRACPGSLGGRNGLTVPPGPDLRVVQVERGALGPDARDGGEVVPRRRAGRRPFQRVRVAPRVVGRDTLAVPRGLVDVVEEDERGRAEDPRADAGDLVQRGHVVRQEGVVGDPPRHPIDAEPVLDQERHVKADEQGPEMPDPQGVVEHLPGE